jgi:timeless
LCIFSDGDDESIAIVPLTEEQEDAMEREEFRAMLRALGVKAPSSEQVWFRRCILMCYVAILMQERFWRIPSHMTTADLRSRADALAPPSAPQENNSRLQNLKNLVQKKKENTASEKRKRFVSIVISETKLHILMSLISVVSKKKLKINPKMFQVMKKRNHENDRFKVIPRGG